MFNFCNKNNKTLVIINEDEFNSQNYINFFLNYNTTVIKIINKNNNRYVLVASNNTTTLIMQYDVFINVLNKNMNRQFIVFDRGSELVICLVIGMPFNF